jgi:hypothetical protein
MTFLVLTQLGLSEIMARDANAVGDANAIFRSQAECHAGAKSETSRESDRGLKAGFA